MKPVAPLSPQKNHLLDEEKNLPQLKERGLVLNNSFPIASPKPYAWFSSLTTIFLRQPRINPIDHHRNGMRGCHAKACTEELDQRPKKAQEYARRCGVHFNSLWAEILRANHHDLFIANGAISRDEARMHIDSCLYSWKDAKSAAPVRSSITPVAQILGEAEMWPAITLSAAWFGLANSRRASAAYWNGRIVGEAALYGDEKAVEHLTRLLSSDRREVLPEVAESATYTLLELARYERLKPADEKVLNQARQRNTHGKANILSAFASRHSDQKIAQQAFAEMLPLQPDSGTLYRLITETIHPEIAAQAYALLEARCLPPLPSKDAIENLLRLALDPACPYRDRATAALRAQQVEDSKTPAPQKQTMDDSKEIQQLIARLNPQEEPVITQQEAHDWLAFPVAAGGGALNRGDVLSIAGWDQWRQNDLIPVETTPRRLIKMLTVLADSEDGLADRARILLRRAAVLNCDAEYDKLALCSWAELARSARVEITKAEARGVLCSLPLQTPYDTRPDHVVTQAVYGLYKDYQAFSGIDPMKPWLLQVLGGLNVPKALSEIVVGYAFDIYLSRAERGSLEKQLYA
jgi:hypothetical protein